jgi:tetratricopeptide (TPR) repeat protein
MGRSRRLIFFLAVSGLAGCAQKAPPMMAGSTATQPSGRAWLTLDQIQPVLVLPPAAAVDPDSLPPLDAIELYARAQTELLDGHRLKAIPILERAAALDPASLRLHLDLAEAYRGSFGYEDHSIAELEKAAAIEPGNLDVHLDLGRQLLAKGDAAAALEHLRLAILTQDYREGAGRAPEADLFLAHALQQQGYDRAALERYELLLTRLNNRDLSHTANPDLAFQVTDKLHTQVGDLYMRQNNPAAALGAYRSALHDADQAHEAGDPGLYARIVRADLLCQNVAQAQAEAADAVRQCRASPESIALLSETCQETHQAGGVSAALTRLHEQFPGEKPILFALIDVMRAQGKASDADHLLSVAVDQAPGDGPIVRKRAELHQIDGDLSGAARVLIEATARQPALAGELADMWDRLLQPSDPVTRERLSLSALRGLPVKAGAEASRSYAVALYAQRWPKRAAARAALDDAVRATPAFAPAFRDRLDQIWSDASQTRESQLRRTDELVDAATRAGDASLAAELRGRKMLITGDQAAGAAAIADAVKLAGDPAGGIDPDLQLALADSYRAAGDDAAFEETVRKVIADHPASAPACQALHDHFWAQSQYQQAQSVAASWRDADPAGLAARICQARDQVRLSHAPSAQVMLTGLAEEFPDDPQVLSACQELYAQEHRLDELAKLLQDQFARRPRAFHCAQLLARIESGAGRVDEASRVLDAARAAAADEPDVLYDLSQAYNRLGQRQTAEDVLQQVLKLDPLHAGASNDLGYAWAVQGRNLGEAEALARVAVTAEPDNAALLDSLGWVLYKRGRFDEAREALEQAVGPAFLAGLTGGDDAATREARVDPVLLDHLGDVMYRLHNAEAAGKLWERSWARLGEMVGAPPDRDGDLREELVPLRLELQQKQRQLKAGRPVTVAPVAEPIPTSSPAPPTTRAARAGQ